MYPLDVLRIRFFLRQKVNWLLFNGLGFSLTAASLKQALFFPTQDILGRQMRRSGYTEHWADLITGVLFGLATNPINAVKVPLQASTRKTSASNMARSIYDQHGIRGFYRGGGAVMLRDITWTVGYFPIYRKIVDRTDNRVISSLGASVIATTIAYPFDGSRLCRQHHGFRHSFSHGIRESFRLTSYNLSSYLTGVTRVALATLTGHYTYLCLDGGT